MWQAAAAIFCVKSKCGKIDTYRERQSSESLQKPYFHVFLINLHSTQYMYLQCVSAQVPRDLRAGVALHLPRHPQHPAVLRHAPGRAAQAPPHHQQVQWRSVRMRSM